MANGFSSLKHSNLLTQPGKTPHSCICCLSIGNSLFGIMAIFVIAITLALGTSASATVELASVLAFNRRLLAS